MRKRNYIYNIDRYLFVYNILSALFVTSPYPIGRVGSYLDLLVSGYPPLPPPKQNDACPTTRMHIIWMSVAHIMMHASSASIKFMLSHLAKISQVGQKTSDTNTRWLALWPRRMPSRFISFQPEINCARLFINFARAAAHSSYIWCSIQYLVGSTGKPSKVLR